MGEMWNRVPWLNPVDMAIVQLLSPPKPLKLTPANIALNIEYNRGYVAKRCKVLVDRGLLERNDDTGEPYYCTTEFGNRFARGEVSAQELRDDQDSE